MSGTTFQDEIREINLAYVMLAQRMLRQDRESAMFRLGIGADVAELLLGLTSAQLVKLATSQMLLPRLRFEDKLLVGLLAGQGRDVASSGLHAAILATGLPVENRAKELVP